MNRIPLSGLLLPKAAVALCLLGATAGTSNAQHYAPGQKPRIGTRFLNFMKDLVYNEEPENRYRGYAPPSAPAQQHSYGARGNGRRLNLDEPPPAARYTPPGRDYRPSPPAQDMPYPSPAPSRPVKKDKEERVEESPPPAPKPKSRTSTPPSQTALPPSKPAPTKKSLPKEEVEETPPPSKPEKKKTTPPVETAANDTPPPRNVEPEPKKQPEPPAASSSGAALTGTKTSKAGLVKSPYAPYNELDVTGLPSGSLAMDPTTGKVFRVP